MQLACFIYLFDNQTEEIKIYYLFVLIRRNIALKNFVSSNTLNLSSGTQINSYVIRKVWLTI